MSKPSLTRFARPMAALTLIGLIAALVVGPLIWLLAFDWLMAVGGLPGTFGHLPMELRLVGAAVTLAGGALRAWGLAGLRRTFLEAAAGMPLSARAVLGFRRFARVELVLVPLGVVSHSLSMMIVTWFQPPGQRALPIAIGTPELVAAFLGLLLVFVAEVFAEGQRAADENAGFL